MKINLANIKKARNLLNKRECVAIPTETVYGIAGNAYSDTACKKIFRLKKRPMNNPLIIHYYDLKKLKDILKSVENKYNKLKIDHDKNIILIKDLNNQIDELNKNYFAIEKIQKTILNQNQKLKKDNKSLLANNLKLNENISNLEMRIDEQNIEIDLYLKEIKDLNDKSHHGG